MVAAGRDGVDIAQQMQAVVSALDQNKTLIDIDHTERHLEEMIGPLPSGVRSDPCSTATA